MSGYDNPDRVSLFFGGQDFGASNVLRELALPTTNGGFNGAKVVGVIFINISELFAATTLPRVDVGVIGGDADAYFSTGGLPVADMTTGESVYVEDSGLQIDVPVNDATNLHKVLLTFVAGITAPTGICDVTLLIDVY